MEIFKDNNNWNEKSIIGLGRDLAINEFVYDSFVLVVLGCFGIAGLEKFAKK